MAYVQLFSLATLIFYLSKFGIPNFNLVQKIFTPSYAFGYLLKFKKMVEISSPAMWKWNNSMRPGLRISQNFDIIEISYFRIKSRVRPKFTKYLSTLSHISFHFLPSNGKHPKCVFINGQQSKQNWKPYVYFKKQKKPEMKG